MKAWLFFIGCFGLGLLVGYLRESERDDDE